MHFNCVTVTTASALLVREKKWMMKNSSNPRGSDPCPVRNYKPIMLQQCEDKKKTPGDKFRRRLVLLHGDVDKISVKSFCSALALYMPISIRRSCFTSVSSLMFFLCEYYYNTRIRMSLRVNALRRMSKLVRHSASK